MTEKRSGGFGEKIKINNLNFSFKLTVFLLNTSNDKKEMVPDKKRVNEHK